MTFGTKTVSQAFIFPSRLRKSYGSPRELRRPARPIAARDTRDWRERRDTWNQGLRVSPIALDVPVLRLRALADLFSILLKGSMFGRNVGTQTLTGRS